MQKKFMKAKKLGFSMKMSCRINENTGKTDQQKVYFPIFHPDRSILHHGTTYHHHTPIAGPAGNGLRDR